MMMSDEYKDYTDKTICSGDALSEMSEEQALHVFESLVHAHQI